MRTKYNIIKSDTRQPTYLDKQADHVTPYGFVNNAIIFTAREFLKVSNSMVNLSEDSDEFSDKQKRKLYLRNHITEILSAVLILNEIDKDNSSNSFPFDFSADDSKQVKQGFLEDLPFNFDDSDLVQDNLYEDSNSLLDTSSSSDNSLNISSSSSNVDNIAFNKREKNIFGIEELVYESIRNYESTVENYVLVRNKIQEDKKSILEGKVENIASEELRAREKMNNYGIESAKRDFVIATMNISLKLFNNIKGITYNNPGNRAKDLIKKNEYFNYDSEKRLSGDSGDSPFVSKALSVFSEINAKVNSANQDEVVAINHDNLVNAINNSFFLPKLDNFIDENYDSDNVEIEKRQNSSGELKHHMARHIFLLIVCYPFLKEREFREIAGAVKSKENIGEEENKGYQRRERTGRNLRNLQPKEVYNFDHFVKAFVKNQVVTRYGLSESEVPNYLDGVMNYYNKFIQDLENYRKRIEVKPTPLKKNNAMSRIETNDNSLTKLFDDDILSSPEFLRSSQLPVSSNSYVGIDDNIEDYAVDPAIFWSPDSNRTPVTKGNVNRTKDLNDIPKFDGLDDSPGNNSSNLENNQVSSSPRLDGDHKRPSSSMLFESPNKKQRE